MSSGVRKAALIGAVVATFGPAVALAQSSTHYKTWPEVLRQVEQSGTVPLGWSREAVKTVKTVPVPDRGWAPVMPEPPLGETVVIRYGNGGMVAEHNLRFGAYKRANTKVEIRGPCYSACTLITAYIGKDNLCIAEGAFLAFHAVRSASTHIIQPAATELMYWQQPIEIRSWIDRTGGHQNLPLDGFWPLHDRELWAMGYPKCQ